MEEVNQDVFLVEKYLSEGNLPELKKIYEKNLDDKIIVEKYLTYLMENGQFKEVVEITLNSIRSGNINKIIRNAKAKIAKELLLSGKFEELEKYTLEHLDNNKVGSICIKGHIKNRNYERAIEMCEMYLENKNSDIIKSQYVTALSRKTVKNSKEKRLQLQKALDVLNSIENKNEITLNQTVLMLGKLGMEVESIETAKKITTNTNTNIYICSIYALRGEVIEIKRILDESYLNKTCVNSLKTAKKNNKDIYENIQQDDSIENYLKLHKKYPSNVSLKERIVYHYIKNNQIEDALMYIQNLENREYVMIALYKKCIELGYKDIARQIAEKSYRYCNNKFLNNRIFHYLLADDDMINLESHVELIQDNNKLVSIYIKKLIECGCFEKVVEIAKRYPEDMIIQSQALSAHFNLGNVKEAKLIYEQNKEDEFIKDQGRLIYFIEEFGNTQLTMVVKDIILEEKYKKEKNINVQHLYNAIENKDRMKILTVLMLLGKRKEVEEEVPDDYEKIKQIHLRAIDEKNCDEER